MACTEIEYCSFRKKAFEQQCVLLHAFLNRGELAAQFSFIGLNDANFNSQCLSNAKCLFYETLSPKKHGKVIFDKKGYQYAVLFSFTAITPVITTATHRG